MKERPYTAQEALQMLWPLLTQYKGICVNAKMAEALVAAAEAMGKRLTLSEPTEIRPAFRVEDIEA
ncbi:MAG: hypothetical protein WBK91_03920 [Alphaproteobacteria bacterium]